MSYFIDSSAWIEYLEGSEKGEKGRNILKSEEDIFNVTPKIAKDAGLLHAGMKSKNSSFSLADALIIFSARFLKAKILTKDPHFKECKKL